MKNNYKVITSKNKKLLYYKNNLCKKNKEINSQNKIR